MEVKDKNLLEQITQLGALLGGKIVEAGKGAAPLLMVSNDMTLKSLEEYLELPLTTRAQVKLISATSFVNYLNEHKVDATRIFARFATRSFVLDGVIDYHTPTGAAARGLHVANLEMQYSEQWQLWMAGNDKFMRQSQFADFIEENVDDFHKPKAAEMLEMVRDFRATKKATFASTVNAANGDHQFEYSIETSPQKTKHNHLEVPETFEIMLPVFEGEPEIIAKAWLRYDIDHEGRLSLKYKLNSPEKILRTEGERLLEDIKTRTNVAVYDGSVTI